MEEEECWKMILWWEVEGRGFAAPSRGFYQSSEDNLRLKSIKTANKLCSDYLYNTCIMVNGISPSTSFGINIAGYHFKIESFS